MIKLNVHNVQQAFFGANLPINVFLIRLLFVVMVFGSRNCKAAMIKIISLEMVVIPNAELSKIGHVQD